MKGNLFIRAALGLIAFFLAVIALRPFLAPGQAAGIPRKAHESWGAAPTWAEMKP